MAQPSISNLYPNARTNPCHHRFF